MSIIEHKEFKTELSLIGIDIIETNLKLPDFDTGPLSTYNYRVDIETRFDPTKNTVLVIVTLLVLTEDQITLLGTIKTGFQFTISNFHEIIKIKSGEAPLIPVPLFDVLISISISTTRGIMYTQFKGTFLHNAILPIFDPKAFKQEGTK